MTNEHPIIPPASLLDAWFHQHYGSSKGFSKILIEVAQWGADTELEACCKWLNGGSEIDYDTAALLRAARRPKPPSLKEQALLAIDTAVADDRLSADVASIVRRALEVIPNV